MKRRYLKVALVPEVYSALCRQADARGQTLSDLVRERISSTEQAVTVETVLARVEQKLAAPVVEKTTVSADDSARALTEILYLARELAADRNAQIVARVAAKLRAEGVQHGA